MPIEKASYITDLNVSFPRTTDLLKEGSGHLRLIKHVLSSTFPNLGTEVKYSSDELNALSSNAAVSATGVTLSNNVSVDSSQTIDMGFGYITNVGSNKSASMSNTPTDLVTHAAIKAAFCSMYPKNSVYCTGLADVNPSTLPMFVGTTWVPFSPGRYLGSVGSLGDWTFTASTGGQTGANIDNVQYLPVHSHPVSIDSLYGKTITSSNTGDHQHDSGMFAPGAYVRYFGSGTNNSSGSHSQVTSGAYAVNTSALPSYMDGNGNHYHTFNIDHSHSASSNSIGPAATRVPAPIQPMWQSFYFWQRTDDKGVWF